MSDAVEVTYAKWITVVDVPPFKNIKVVLDDGFVQVEVGYYPGGTGRRLATYARRVYVDEGGEAVFILLNELAETLSSGLKVLPVWERGDYIPGYRVPGEKAAGKEVFGYDDTA